MNEIRSICDRLNDVEATISDFNRDSPSRDSFAMRLALQSLERRRDELKEMLQVATEQGFVDVCNYRIIPAASGHYPVKSIGLSLATFQDTLTSFFASIRDDKPRAQMSKDPEILSASELNFGYSYSGSLGVVLYAFNDELFSGSSALDDSIRAIFELSTETDLEKVRANSEKYGKAALRSFYDWSKVQTDSNLSLDIQWTRGKEVKLEKTVQPEHLASVQDILRIARSTDDTPENVTGLLVALNVTGDGYFKMVFAERDRQEISGKLSPDFDRDESHEIPHRYTAKVMRTSTTSMYSDDDKVTWTLISLS